MMLRATMHISQPYTHNPRLRKMPMASFQFSPVKRKETMGNVRTEIGHVGAGCGAVPERQGGCTPSGKEPGRF